MATLSLASGPPRRSKQVRCVREGTHYASPFSLRWSWDSLPGPSDTLSPGSKAGKKCQNPAYPLHLVESMTEESSASVTPQREVSIRIPLFANTTAGKVAELREVLKDTLHFDVHEVPPRELDETIQSVLETAPKRVAVAGGDGTIGTAAAHVVGKPIELAIIPCGTLNHFARDYGVPTDLSEAAQLAASSTTVRNVDVGFVGDRLFLNTSSVGAYVSFVDLRERLERRVGYRLASLLAFVRMFFRLRRVYVELEVNGTSHRYRSALVFVGVGERTLQVPELGSRVAAGKRSLHIFVVQESRPARVLTLGLAAALRGVPRARRSPAMDTFLVDRCTIDLGRPRALVAVDGEVVQMNGPLEYRIERDHLHLVTAPARLIED
jgi:diacylglycerol kinase family enzyme